MKSQFIVTLLVFLLSLVLSSCSTETIMQTPIYSSPSNAEITSLQKIDKDRRWPPEYIIDSCFGYGKIYIDTNLTKAKKNNSKDSVVNPSLYWGDGCNQRTIYGWGIDHYEPIPGKVLGIWNGDVSQSQLTYLKNSFGYSGLFIMGQGTYDLAVSQLKLFEPANIIVSIACEDIGSTVWQSLIDNCPAGTYYIDEAVNHACTGNSHRMYSPSDFITYRDYMNNHGRSGSLLVTSGYKRCSHLNTIANYCDKIMYSSYDNWYYLSGPGVFCYNTNMSWGQSMEAGAFIDGSYDQRDSWTDMYNLFGNKFTRTWINTCEVTEFSLLFGHAANLGIDQVWVYNYDTAYRTDQYSAISLAAYQAGYLKQFIKELRLVYRCDKYVNPNLPCPCDPTIEEDWRLVSITETGNVKENR